jgi:hypothetical protein
MMILDTNFRYAKPLTPLNLSKVFFVILHHTEIAVAEPADIHQWHLGNGWDGFGYNEYIRKNGSTYIGRGDNIGAHCMGMNANAYGICFEGNYDTENMPKAQFDAGMERIKHNMLRFVNCTGVYRHGRFVATSCPGKNFPYSALVERSTDLDWKRIIEKVSTDKSLEWEKAIELAVRVAKSDIDMGDLEILAFLPILIEKIYSTR